MTLKVYTVLLGLILIFYILTVRYRRTLRKKFKKDKLSPLYGMSMFIADIYRIFNKKVKCTGKHKKRDLYVSCK